ncbi:MAG: rod shape-determining protein RodA [Planctomycetes bacterium]|nr:rod shape-determining protein RodA [Planctomycetota bacterium]
MIERRPLLATRWMLGLVVGALTAVGILFVHSTTASPDESFPSQSARAQLVKLAVALIAYGVVSRMDYRWFARHAYAAFALLCALLGLLVAVRYTSGEMAVRWFHLWFFNVQPSELMKLGVIVCLARYLCYREDQRRLGGLALPSLLAFVPMLLVALQPDLGTSLMFPPVLLSLLFVARARPGVLLASIVLAAAALPLVYALKETVDLDILHKYQLRRLTGYFQQWDPDVRRDEAYQLWHSLVAMGSGGWTGKGWGQGSLNSLGWVPAHHTDFIFSIIGEEWGLVGTASVTLLFLALVTLCFRVALRTREPFGRLVATGIAVAFAAQSIENICMTVGLTPVTGLTLPFVSFGGSSLVTSFIAVGLLVSVARHRVRVVATADLDPEDPVRNLRVAEDRPSGLLARRWPV